MNGCHAPHCEISAFSPGLLWTEVSCAAGRLSIAWSWPASRALSRAVSSAKSMIVTLPFVLLLLDDWPLNRWRLTGENVAAHNLRLVLEKTPLVALALVSSVVTYIQQQRVGKVMYMGELPMTSRLANALVSYTKYLAKTVWPTRMAVFYPYPNSFPVIEVLGAVLVLAAISILAIRLVRRQPYLIVGWLWFLGTLVPVGGRAMAGDTDLGGRRSRWRDSGLLRSGVCPGLLLAEH